MYGPGIPTAREMSVSEICEVSCFFLGTLLAHVIFDLCHPYIVSSLYRPSTDGLIVNITALKTICS